MTNTAYELQNNPHFQTEYYDIGSDIMRPSRSKIELIKALRRLTGLGLKEAKEQIERVIQDNETIVVEVVSDYTSPNPECEMDMLNKHGVLVDVGTMTPVETSDLVDLGKVLKSLAGDNDGNCRPTDTQEAIRNAIRVALDNKDDYTAHALCRVLLPE